MFRRHQVAVRIVYLLTLGTGGLFTASAIWNSVTDYEPPPPIRGDLTQGPALTDRLVLIILDGIRLDAVEEMEFLNGASARGASWTLQTVQPSLSNPARAVLSTGAWPELNGVTNNGKYSPPAVDSIFSLARAAGLATVAAGSSFWKHAFGAHLDEVVTSRAKKLRPGAPAAELIAWQQGLCNDYTEALRQDDAGLLVAGLFAADAAGHDYGGESPEYVEVVEAVDGCVKSLVGALDDGQTTFLLTSDHGHIHYRGHGGHGGPEPVVTRVPFVAWGPGIRSVSGGSAEQVDVAPTICALLGLPLPASAQGRILMEAIDAPDSVLGRLRSLQERQREIAAGQVADPVEGRKLERRERSLRTLGMLTFFSAVVFGTGFRRPRSFLLALAGLIVYYLLYYAGFSAMGLGYSLSVVGRAEYLLSFFGRNLAVEAAAFAIAGYLISPRAHAGASARLFLDLGILVTASIALQVVVLYFQHGLFMERFMPPLDMAFKACLDLSGLAAVAATATIGFTVQRAVDARAARGASG